MEKQNKTAEQLKEELRDELHHIKHTMSPLQRILLEGKFKAQ